MADMEATKGVLQIKYGDNEFWLTNSSKYLRPGQLAYNTSNNEMRIGVSTVANTENPFGGSTWINSPKITNNVDWAENDPDSKAYIFNKTHGRDVYASLTVYDAAAVDSYTQHPFDWVQLDEYLTTTTAYKVSTNFWDDTLFVGSYYRVSQIEEAGPSLIDAEDVSLLTSFNAPSSYTVFNTIISATTDADAVALFGAGATAGTYMPAMAEELQGVIKIVVEKSDVMTLDKEYLPFEVGSVEEFETLEGSLVHNVLRNADRIADLETGVPGTMNNPILVPNGTDFNTLKTSGWYSQGLDTNVTNNTNMPAVAGQTKYAFIMEVLQFVGTTTILQRMYAYPGYTFQRTYQSWNNTWTAWKSSNPPVELWKGQLQSGSITISGLSLYSVYIINIGGVYCFGFSNTSTDYIYVSTSWVADNNVMGTLACAFQKTGDTLTTVVTPSYMFHNGSSTHSNRMDSYVYSVHGLL